jgi:death on curing protein
MRKISKKNIITINERTIKAHGGNFVPPHNFLHESNLDYLIEIIDAEMFGEPLYPHIWDKAAIYLYNIICNHIFSDGNKRTGLEAALLFLEINGYRVKLNLSQDDLLNFVIEIASGQKTLDECRDWLKDNIEHL